MSQVILFEDHRWVNFLPLVYWRSIFELRAGRKVFLDRSAQRLGKPIAGIWARDWLASVAAQRCGAPANSDATSGSILVNGRWVFDGPVEFPNKPCFGRIGDDVAFIVCDEKIASRLTPELMLDSHKVNEALAGVECVHAEGRFLQYPWDVVNDVGHFLETDWKEDDAVVESEIDSGLITDPSRLHVGQRTTIHPTVVLDAERAPVFISHDVTIGAYAVIEGPIYIGPGSKVHPHALLHGGNSIGPVCKLGGEIHGCVIDGYSNKQHGGFLGHSYVGNWVNLGAGCNNSDLKNTYGSVRVRQPSGEVDTGMTFFGATIGDHAKIGINATIPTGAYVGFAASVATTRVLPVWIPSLSWLTESGSKAGDPARLLDVATKVMARRGIDMTDEEVDLFLDLGTRAVDLESGRA